MKPTHARLSLLAAPRSAAVGASLAAVTAVLATAALTASSAGHGQAPRARQQMVAAGQPMVRTAGDLNGAYVAGGVVAGSGLAGAPGTRS